MSEDKFWLGLLVVLAGLAGLRIREWKSEEWRILAGEVSAVQMRLVDRPDHNMYGCSFDWRGWRMITSSAICESSNLYNASAGDVLNLEVDFESGLDQKYRQLVVERVVVIKSKLIPGLSWWWWQARMTSLRGRAVGILRQVLPETEAGLVSGILLGVKSGLSDEFKQALIKTGTMHVVAASGYNISVMAAVLMKLTLIWWDRKRAAGICLLAIWGYVMIAGADPPIVRAGIMGSLVLLGWMFGREFLVLLGYLISGGLMLVVSPWLMESVSFQLSMAATVGVIWGTKALERLMECVLVERMDKNQIFNYFKSNLLTTLAATIAVGPISLIWFGEVSVMGLIVNPALLGLVPILMYLGLITVGLGLVWLPLARAVGWLGLPVAKMWVMAVMTVGRFSGEGLSLDLNWFGAWGWWLVWAGLALIILKRKAHC